MMKMFAKCLLVCGVLLPMAETVAAQTESSDFKPHFEGGVYAGYTVPIAYDSGLVCPEVVAGYRFNPICSWVAVLRIYCMIRIFVRG